MKTTLEKIYKPSANYHIAKVLIVDKERTLVFLHSNSAKNPSYVELLKFGEVVSKHNISSLNGYDHSNYSPRACCILQNQLAVILSTGKIAFLNLDNFDDSTLLNIDKYPKPDSFNRTYTTNLVSYNKFNNKFIVGSQGFGHQQPRFLSTLSEAGFIRKVFALDKTIELPRNKYPKSKIVETHGELYLTGEWVHIRELFTVDADIYTHTLGFSHPRVLGNVYSDFSLISQFDHNLNFINNFEIEDGIGNSSVSNDYFIVNPRKNKARLYFYSTSNFKVDYEISLTPKQNLGDEKNQWIKADLVDDLLLVYNSSFLHFCSLI